MDSAYEFIHLLGLISQTNNLEKKLEDFSKEIPTKYEMDKRIAKVKSSFFFGNSRAYFLEEYYKRVYNLK